MTQQIIDEALTYGMPDKIAWYETLGGGAKDSDGDGVNDDEDAFPDDPSETADSDKDGVGDNADVFPRDPSEVADCDNDGVGDNEDRRSLPVSMMNGGILPIRNFLIIS